MRAPVGASLGGPRGRCRRRGDGIGGNGWYCEARALVLTLPARECSRGVQPCSSAFGGLAVARGVFPGAEPPEPPRTRVVVGRIRLLRGSPLAAIRLLPALLPRTTPLPEVSFRGPRPPHPHVRASSLAALACLWVAGAPTPAFPLLFCAPARPPPWPPTGRFPPHPRLPAAASPRPPVSSRGPGPRTPLVRGSPLAASACSEGRRWPPSACF